MVIEYLISFIAALALLIAYFIIVKKKEFWLTMLYCCVPIVNLGYTLLSLSKTLEFAIFSNDVVYFGSIFLSMFMFLTIVKLCGFQLQKKILITCLLSGTIMFLIVVTSPMIPLYYKSVDIELINGSTKLVKEYGILHPLYLFYLLGYLILMIYTIILSIKKKKIGQTKYALFIAGIVCSNILIWLFEKFINWEFEFLSLTYIISELLLLLVYWMIQDYVLKNDIPSSLNSGDKMSVIFMDSKERAEKIQKIISKLPEGTILTARQMDILEGILDGKSRKEIAFDLHLSENTVKMHTTSLFRNLKVTSREEIFLLIND